MKILGLMAVLMALVACPSTPTPAPFTGDTPSLSGKIANWTAGKTGFLRVKMATNGTILGAAVLIGSDGSFSNLPFPGNAAIGTNLAAISSSITASLCGPDVPTVIVTPSDAKVAAGLLEVLNNTPASSGTVIEATRADELSGNTQQVGDHFVLRIFADKAATVKGACSQAGTQSKAGTFDFSLQAGWNNLILELTSISETAVNVRYLAGEVPSNVQMFLAAFGAPLKTDDILKH